jgi:hypothetical protein
LKLGKKEYKDDKRTVKMLRFLDTELHCPTRFDFDRGRSAFPSRMWGNDAYGDCVFAGEMNHLLRVERVETRKTLQASDQDVIQAYQTLTGCRQPDDANDQGYVMLDALNWWRHDGWTVHGHNYTIDAFGELEPSNFKQLRLACYLLHGIEFGFALPRSAQSQTHQGYWDVSEGPDSVPGSWGGHAVFAKRYDANNFYVLTWGREIRVSNAFVARYADEAWAVVDSLNKWRKHDGFNIAALEKYLDQIGAARK